MASVGVLKLGNISLEKTALFVCDLQEKFQPAIAHFADIVDVTKRLVSKCLLWDRRTLYYRFIITKL